MQANTTLDDLETKYSDAESLLFNHEFYEHLEQLFPTTDGRVIRAVAHAVVGEPVFNSDASKVREIAHAIENGFDHESHFLSEFNEQNPASKCADDDRAEWENTALVIVEDSDTGRKFWAFEGSE